MTEHLCSVADGARRSEVANDAHRYAEVGSVNPRTCAEGAEPLA
jgi:hypothetical protein